MDGTLYEVSRWLSDQTGIGTDRIGTQMALRDFAEDSLQYVELVMAFEDTHGVDVRHPFTPLETVGDLVAYLEGIRAEPVRLSPRPS